MTPSSPSLTYKIGVKRASRFPETENVMKRAKCARASRAARACDPSAEAKHKAHLVVASYLKDFREKGIEKAPKEPASYRLTKPQSSSYKASDLPSSLRGKLTHITTIKTRNIDANNSEATWILGGRVAPMRYDRLAESSLRSNAVHSSVTGRKKTQGVCGSRLFSPRSIIVLTSVCFEQNR